MSQRGYDSSVGLLLSGGLDSCILLGHLLAEGCTVQPFYVRCGLAWEQDELAAARRFLAAVESPQTRPLVVFEQPVGDLYGPHWSVTGCGVPPSDAPDEAVYLPGRNALLLIKPALWCAAHAIRQLALAVLASNPFSDTSEAFFYDYASALGRAVGQRLEFIRPFEHLCKTDVLRMGHKLPLELSLSCVAPVAGRHCGRCNKCAERKAAFANAGLEDKTPYAPSP